MMATAYKHSAQTKVSGAKFGKTCFSSILWKNTYSTFEQVKLSKGNFPQLFLEFLNTIENTRILE